MSLEFISGSGDWSLVTFLMRGKVSWWISRRRWSWGPPAQKTKKKPGSEKLVVSVSCEDLSMKWKVSEHLYTNHMIDDRTWLEPIDWSMDVSAKMKGARGSRVKHPSVSWSADVSIWLFTPSGTLHTPVNQPACGYLSIDHQSDNRSQQTAYHVRRDKQSAVIVRSSAEAVTSFVLMLLLGGGCYCYYYIILFCYFGCFIVEVTELINDEMIIHPR